MVRSTEWSADCGCIWWNVVSGCRVIIRILKQKKIHNKTENNKSGTEPKRLRQSSDVSNGGVWVSVFPVRIITQQKRTTTPNDLLTDDTRRASALLCRPVLLTGKQRIKKSQWQANNVLNDSSAATQASVDTGNTDDFVKWEEDETNQRELTYIRTRKG